MSDTSPDSATPGGTPPAGIGRRGLVGFIGSAVAGAGIGAVGGAAVAQATAESAPLVRRAGETVSPWGRHQPGIALPAPAVTETVALDVLDDLAQAHDSEAIARLMRVWTGDIEAFALGRGAPGDPAPWLASAGADVTITVGIGGRLLADDGWGIERPTGWTPVPPMSRDRLEESWSGGDLVLVVGGRDHTTVGHVVRRMIADAAPFASPRWRQVGSWNGFGAKGEAVTGRNLFGQVDGSRNPVPGTDEFERTVWIAGGQWRDGTTLVVRRISMNLPEWDELTRSEQEATVGRRLDDGAPLTGGGELDDVDLTARKDGIPVIALDSHVRLSHPSTNGQRRIFRKGGNYEVHGGQGSDTGLVFASYQADISRQFVPIQRNLDSSDALNEWTTAIGSAEFAILPGFDEGEWLGQHLIG